MKKLFFSIFALMLFLTSNVGSAIAQQARSGYSPFICAHFNPDYEITGWGNTCYAASNSYCLTGNECNSIPVLTQAP